MESEELKIICARYNDLKCTVQKSSTILNEPGKDIKEIYHIGYKIEGSSRSSLAQFHSCVHRDLILKRVVKTYYIGDVSLTKSGLFFPSHPSLGLELILNEIRALSELNHPNIIRLFEVFMDNKFIHLVFETCKGRELFDRLASEKLQLDVALNIFIEILEALRYMHEKGYMHRGLCIENIMFADHGMKKVKLIGFCGAIKSDEKVTVKYGAPMYMAPEMYQGSYDEKCDVWAAGVILFTMITGHQPYQAPTLIDLSKAVVSNKMLKSENWENCPKDIKKLINSVLTTKKRPSAESILNFKVILKHQQNYNKSAIKQLMKTIKSIVPESSFSYKVKLANKLKVVVYKILAPLNLIHNLAALERLWNELDVNNNDEVCEEDIVNNIERIMRKQGIGKKAQYILKKFDLDKRGSINKDEFIGLLCDLSDKSLLRQAFNILDFDGNGVVSASDFDIYFKCSGYQNLEKLMQDGIENQTMDYETFSLLITKFSNNS